MAGEARLTSVGLAGYSYPAVTSLPKKIAASRSSGRIDEAVVAGGAGCRELDRLARLAALVALHADVAGVPERLQAPEGNTTCCTLPAW